MEVTMNTDMPGVSRLIYTPRTPRNRERQRFSLGVAPVEKDELVDTLEELLHQTWTVFGVSALFNFQQDDVHFKLYAKRLREGIANILSKEDVVYNAKFSVVESITPRPSPEDPPATKIEVFTKTTDRQENIEKCIYKAILLSWRSTNIESNAGNYVRLPLLLCRGTRSGMNAVHSIMGRMFDCMITPLPAKADDLMWLIPIMITPSSKEEQFFGGKEIQMEYTVPGLPVTDNLTVKFHSKDLIKLLTTIIENQNNETTVEAFLEAEQIEKFYEILYRHMLDVSGIRLGLCTLHKINTPIMTIMENRMKVLNSEVLNRVLLYLNEKALDTFHALHFDV